MTPEPLFITSGVQTQTDSLVNSPPPVSPSMFYKPQELIRLERENNQLKSELETVRAHCSELEDNKIHLSSVIKESQYTSKQNEEESGKNSFSIIRESLSNSILESRKGSLSKLTFVKDGLQSRTSDYQVPNRRQKEADDEMKKITQSVPLISKPRDLDDSGFSFRTRPTPDLPNELNKEAKAIAQNQQVMSQVMPQQVYKVFSDQDDSQTQDQVLQIKLVIKEKDQALAKLKEDRGKLDETIVRLETMVRGYEIKEKTNSFLS